MISRIKDLIILKGRNIFPADIEDLCRDVHPGLSRTAICAIAEDGPDGENLSVAIEETWDTRIAAEDRPILKRKIAARITEATGIAPAKSICSRRASSR